MTIRRAAPPDALLLAQHRAAVWHEVGEWSWADLVPQIPVWASFLGRALEDETYVAFVAEDDGTTVGSGAVLVHLAIPRPGSASDRAGRVQSVYVVPAARRLGVARAVMAHILEAARERRLVSLTLHPSEEARALYAGMNFTPVDEMRLNLIG